MTVITLSTVSIILSLCVGFLSTLAPGRKVKEPSRDIYFKRLENPYRV